MQPYRTPCCGKRVFDGQLLMGRVEVKCPECGDVVEPEPESGERPLHRTYRCTNDDCGRTLHVERPRDERSFCVVCGTETLAVVDEVSEAGQGGAGAESNQLPPSLGTARSWRDRAHE